MKTKYPTEIKDLRHQLDHITPKTIQLFQEYGANPNKSSLFLIIFTRRENEIQTVMN